MRRIIVTSLIALLCAAGAAGAQTSASPSAAETVAARKAAFNLSAVAFSTMNAAAASPTPEPRQLSFSAQALARWAHALPGLFPAGTSATDMPGETTASPAIWANRADFEAKAAAYAAAADKLGELTEDTEAFKAQLAVVSDTCKSCHQPYRVRSGH
ncbi:cytochrome c [Brevundimonas goettingensis]|uniref:Cytochrome c n=1 Tax=Brevundimonas goettingensis TaxID=2774190 RepID=A0A975C0B1_9CAUL|nr:cytochrome c [Brevundimonas goettingensis]QTC91351.1 cytochrome c [Brevundimonas goettingensis]